MQTESVGCGSRTHLMKIWKFHRDVDIQIQPNKILRSKYKIIGDCNLYQNLVDFMKLAQSLEICKRNEGRWKEKENGASCEEYGRMSDSLCSGY